ncbi:SDR family NAD(P)-dependent oxidoreductase [Azospirillum sp. B4]|uniref:SDR family NAD(P)-dependent oxidoreductase n=1 Tax=Azospirillum sp. B4 TaxID=95605 RepID=UPI0003476497|nr:SDR family oxidoreductase [Azospirillum sp. B4]
MAPQKLAGKVALVTGGGQGVGLGIAQALAAAGAALVITGRDVAKLEAAARDLSPLGTAGVAICAGDVRRRADAEAAVKVALDRFGRLDVLVNNAQSSKPGTLLEDIDDETIALTLESGLLGTIRHMQAAFPHLKERGGSIINLGSREGIYGGAGFGIYAATKEGVRGVSRVAAREWGRYGIRVNVICPAALSPVAIQYLADHLEQAEMYRKEIALGRFGDPQADIGPVAVFLASDDSRYVTGQTLNADGGQVML